MEEKCSEKYRDKQKEGWEKGEIGGESESKLSRFAGLWFGYDRFSFPQIKIISIVEIAPLPIHHLHWAIL